MQTNERVVVIKGDAEKWYSQAVFFINPSMAKEAIPVDFVAEAEKILYNYMAKNKQYNYALPAHLVKDNKMPLILPDAPKGYVEPRYSEFSKNCYVDLAPTAPVNKKRLGLGFAVNILMFLACVFMAAVVAFGLLN